MLFGGLYCQIQTTALCGTCLSANYLEDQN
jgi:hypothetical protein